MAEKADGMDSMAATGVSSAEALQSDLPPEGRYHVCESSPAPWWVAAIWLSFFVFGATYLVVNLLQA